MMIGNNILKSLFLFIIFSIGLYGKNMLIVPANINYENEDLEYISSTIYNYLNSAVVELNNKNIDDEDKRINLKELVLPVSKDQKKIQKFFKKRKDIKFLERLKSKYNLDQVVWYNLHKSMIQNSTISKIIKLKICKYQTKIECYKLKLKFDRKVFDFTDDSVDYLLKTSKAIIDNG